MSKVTRISKQLCKAGVQHTIGVEQADSNQFFIRLDSNKHSCHAMLIPTWKDTPAYYFLYEEINCTCTLDRQFSTTADFLEDFDLFILSCRSESLADSLV